jgi:hypothetical protein
MAARRFLFLSVSYAFPAVLAALLIVAAPTSVRAEDEPDVPNSKFNFFGEVTGSAVIVRSGPGEQFYPTAKLDKGEKVKVVGIKFNWLKIEPPRGSFSYIGRMLVERHGDGKVGKVVSNNTNIYVRAGSALNPMKSTIQTKLNPGTDVTILGEEDEYFKIEPPTGAYLFVHQKDVKPIADAREGIAAQPAGPEQPVAGGTAPQNNGVAPAPTEVDTATRGIAEATVRRNGAATQPGGLDANSTSQPAAPTPAEAKFDQLEAQFAAASQKPVIDQPLPELISEYEKVTQEELPESLKRVADARLAGLKARQDAREQLVATRRSREDLQKRNQAILAERQELEERIKETQVDFFAAVGTLRTSSLQQGPRGTTLYRLTDPDTGRTLVYVRTANAAQTATLLNQFVGVRGDVRKDPLLRLNVIEPKETVAVDQSKLGNGVAATVMPPSLLSRIPAPTVSTESQNAPVEGQ